MRDSHFRELIKNLFHMTEVMLPRQVLHNNSDWNGHFFFSFREFVSHTSTPQKAILKSQMSSNQVLTF